MSATGTKQLDYAPRERGFLIPSRDGDEWPEHARAVVIPFGLEATVSYGRGTAAGPAAILAASHQVELFDDELWREPYREFGVATLNEPPIKSPQPRAMEQVAGLVADVLDQGRFPLVLGGEHALTAGAIRPFADRFADLAVLQFDAHPDLRDSYLGEYFSHGAAMRRVLDHRHVRLVSVGLRSISAEDAAYIDANSERVTAHLAKDQSTWDIEKIVAPLTGKPIYVSFDIDALDCALVPATGTPVPGGLSYWTALAVLRGAAEVGTIVGGDLVELAPIPGWHASEFTAASLAYKILTYALAGTTRSKA